MSVVSRLLKAGGGVLIFEMHPFAYFFENGFDPQKQNWDAVPSYFNKGPYQYEEGLDYVGGVAYRAGECYWFLHKMSDILGAIARSGMLLQEFEEYNLEMAGNAATKLYDKLPLSYCMTCRKREESGSGRG